MSEPENGEQRSAADEFAPKETARRRDEVVRRMANTPPQPRQKPTRRKGKKKPSASDQAPRKNARDKSDSEA